MESSTAVGAEARQRPVRRGPDSELAAVIGVVAVGGVLGACARYAIALAWPTPVDGFPWATLVINAAGCAVIGAFMTVLTEAWRAHRLVRPFFGTGVLGGFTTFSTYAVDIQRLMLAGRAPAALGYLAATLLAAMVAVWAGAAAARRVIRRRTR
ncbi:fluoride efflux transporter CrcB [Kitasatospora sp. NPDC004614]|uniref:fluoride efflux transporter CrcB n=1 Tax=unclassified Kitasatospora TaxID=2633591 RepID=UPI0036CD0704